MAKPENNRLDLENYDSSYLVFEERQAGVSVIFSAGEERYYYHAYCMDLKLLSEVFSVEYEFLQDALDTINQEFGTWTLKSFDLKQKNCGSCVAK